MYQEFFENFARVWEDKFLRLLHNLVLVYVLSGRGIECLFSVLQSTYNGGKRLKRELIKTDDFSVLTTLEELD